MVPKLFLNPFTGSSASNFLAKPDPGTVYVNQVADSDFIIVQPELAELTASEEGLSWFTEVIHKYQSRTVVLLSHDTDLPMQTFFQDRFICFRTSMTVGRSYALEFLTPPVISNFVDVLKRHDSSFPYSKRPTISFVGHVSPLRGLYEVPSALPFQSNSRSITRKSVFGTPINVGLFLRHMALEALKIDSRIELDAVERNQHFAHANSEEQRKWATDYLESMIRNQYVLCIRGAGNYSIRLYETLAAGRIPIIVNTDQYLFRPSEIPWKDVAVWVEMKDIEKIGELVLDYHHSHSRAQLLEIAANNAALHSRYMSASGVREFVSSVLKDIHDLL